MEISLGLLIAALTVAPADRFALADRFFNRGEYRMAAQEYAALEGEKSIAADALLYRQAECDYALDQKDAARTRFARLLAQSPTSTYADVSRLRLARLSAGEERLALLRALDADRVERALRAEALYLIGEETGDADAYARCVRLDPAGRFRAFALLKRATLLSAGKRREDRRAAVSLFLEVAYGKDAALAERALYQAVVTSFADRQYGEAGALARRYLKAHATAAQAASCQEIAAWCDFLQGKYADALARCGAGATDGMAYVRAASTQAVGDAARARALFAEYLERHAAGRYRKDAELALARLDGELAEKGGDFARVVEAARRCLALSDSAGNRLRLAWALERSAHTEEALHEYQHVAERYPGTPEAAQAAYWKAMIDLRAERWSAAERSLGEALAGKLESARRAEAQYWRGVAACHLDHLAEGCDLLKAALAAGLSLDEAREARLILADADYNAGRTNAACVAYAKLVREGATARMSAAKTLAVGQLLPAEEKRLCAEALVKSEVPDWRQAGYALLADAETALGHAAAAQAAMEKCAAEPCETEALARIAVPLGIRLTEAGRLAEAEVLLKKAVQLNAKNNAVRAAAYLALARNAKAKGEDEAARGYATVIVTLFEKSSQAAEAAQFLAKPEVPK